MADPQQPFLLYEPEGTLLQIDAGTGKAFYDKANQAPADGIPQASLSGSSSVASKSVAPRAGMGGSRKPDNVQLAQRGAGQRALSPQELMALADAMEAKMTQSNEASLAQGPAVKRLAGGTPESGFDTELTSGAEAAFPAWMERTAPGDSGEDYDYRGAFAAGEGRGANEHMTDRFKKPNHPTFSIQSDYADFGAPGDWDQNDQYVPYWKRGLTGGK